MPPGGEPDGCRLPGLRETIVFLCVVSVTAFLAAIGTGTRVSTTWNASQPVTIPALESHLSRARANGQSPEAERAAAAMAPVVLKRGPPLSLGPSRCAAYSPKDVDSSLSMVSRLAGVYANDTTVSDAVFVGDVSFGRDIETFANERYMGCTSYVFDRIRGVLSAADVTFANLESPLITEKEAESLAADAIVKRISLRGSVTGAVALRDAGVDIVTLANNHMADNGIQGVKLTLQRLALVGVRNAGINRGKALGFAQTPVVHALPNGVRVGFLAYCAIATMCGIPRKTMTMGAALYTDAIATRDVGDLRRLVTDAPLAIVVAMHWGDEYQSEPSAEQLSIARHLAKLGVAVVYGHHHHVLQDHAYIDSSDGRTLVMYGAGNFVFDSHVCWSADGKHRDYNSIACMKLEKPQKETVPFEVRKSRAYRVYFASNGTIADAEYLPLSIVKTPSNPLYQPAPVGPWVRLCGPADGKCRSRGV